MFEEHIIQTMQIARHENEEDLFDEALLISHGRNTTDVKKLQDAGIYIRNGVMMHTKKEIGYITGSHALLKSTTKSQALDELLRGGIETSAITETFGQCRSGKTKLDHTLCVFTQKTPLAGGITTASEALAELLGGRTYYAIPRKQVNNLGFGSSGDREEEGVAGNEEDGINNAGLEEHWVDLSGLELLLEEDEDYVLRVGKIVPVLEFTNADWERTCEVEHNLGDRRGEVDLDTCLNWTDLTGKVHLLYVEQTGNQRADGVNTSNCWPGKLAQFCLPSGFPGLDESHPFVDVQVELDSIKIRPHAN